MLAQAELQTIIWTSKLAQAKQFYGGILGLPLKGESDGASIFGVGEQEVRLSPVPSTTPTEHTVIGFAVPDVVRIVIELAACGVRVERFPGLRHDENGVLVTPDGAKFAWFRDMDGNLLSVVQYP